MWVTTINLLISLNLTQKKSHMVRSAGAKSLATGFTTGPRDHLLLADWHREHKQWGSNNCQQKDDSSPRGMKVEWQRGVKTASYKRVLLSSVFVPADKRLSVSSDSGRVCRAGQCRVAAKMCSVCSSVCVTRPLCQPPICEPQFKSSSLMMR